MFKSRKKAASAEAAPAVQEEAVVAITEDDLVNASADAQAADM